jgi:hypothetical protein
MFSRIEDHVSLIWETLLVKFWKDREGCGWVGYLI